MSREESKAGSAAKFKQGVDELNRIGQPKSEAGQSRRNAVEGETSHHGLPMLDGESKGRPKQNSVPTDPSAAKTPRKLRDA